MPSPTGSACSVGFSISSVWTDGSGAEYAVLNLYLQASGSMDISTPLALMFSSPALEGILQAWNFEVSA